MEKPVQPRVIGDGGILNEARELWGIIVDPHARRALTWFAAAIVLVIGANAVAQIRLNDWQGSIFDAISQKDLSVFLWQVVVFVIIVSVLLCLGVVQTWLHEMLKVRLRQAVTYDLLGEWLKPHRVSHLKLGGEISANPDQRIQDDAKRLSELTVDLGVGLVQSTLLLLAFTGVLWELSAQVVFSIDGKPVTIPGYMVWAAIAYALLGSLLTWLVGRPLIKAHSELRSQEADFRFALVRVSESSEEIALYRGEPQERSLLETPVDTLLSTMRRIANRLATLTWVTGGFGWLAILAPLLLAAPGYFGGTLSLGGLMMVSGAFYQVQQSLRWYIDRFPGIAEWQAMLSRVSFYRSALKELHSLGAHLANIRYETDASSISIEDLCVFAPNGRISLGVPYLKVKPGQHILIAATPKSGKSTFLKALAGVWIWGSGTVRVPLHESIMFLPQIPYVPTGSLRAAISYPAPAAAFSDAAVRAALTRMQLDRFLPKLDVVQRWDKELTVDEQRRLVIARLLLHRPQWVIQDESINELDEESRKIALSIFSSELAQTGVLSIGRADPNDTFYEQTFSLVCRLPGLRLPLEFEPETERQDEGKAAVQSPADASVPFSSR
ncbi:MAG: ABC transporter ATP-binding protein/permease [Rhodomicrobium sp.]|nr:ABC transporter ATP-binding protein/permease [Rhodomicrobium sp.]